MLKTCVTASLFAALFAAACAPQDTIEDELAGESAADGEEAGKADAPGGTFTFFTVERDMRKCVSPLCGGVIAARANRYYTYCADGSWQTSCYAAEIDFSRLGLSQPQIGAVWSAIEGKRAILRGRIERKWYEGFGYLGRFVATEAWIGGVVTEPATVPDGVFVKVTRRDLECFAYPCSNLRESKLNSDLYANIADLLFDESGATEEQVAAAFSSLQSDGLLVAGWRDWVSGAAGWAKARTVTQFYSRAVPTVCYRGGCGGQVCSAEPGVFSTCEFRPEHACFQAASCEAQGDNACGYTMTPELQACLEAAGVM